MVSLLVTAVGYHLLASRNAKDAYWRLARAGFLSLRALLNRAGVVSLIEETEATVRSQPRGFGNEAWRDIVRALEREHYLSVFGRTAGGRYVSRPRRW